MSEARTPARVDLDDYLGDVSYATASASSVEAAGSTAATSVWSKLTSRMGQAALPLTTAAVLANIGAPKYRRIFSAGLASQSQVRPIIWLAPSDFMYTEAHITRREIEVLNRLLSLNLEEGFTLDLPDA